MLYLLLLSTLFARIFSSYIYTYTLTNNDFETDTITANSGEWQYSTPYGWIGSQTVLVKSQSSYWLNGNTCVSNSECIAIQMKDNYVAQLVSLPAANSAVVKFYITSRRDCNANCNCDCNSLDNIPVNVYYGSVSIGTLYTTSSWVQESVTIASTSSDRTDYLYFKIGITTNYDYSFLMDLVTITVTAPDPTQTPTAKPSTKTPTAIPTRIPTAIPTRIPTAIPSAIPSAIPTAIPTRIPTAIPTSIPTMKPTAPTSRPSGQPSNKPTRQPTGTPTRQPTGRPSTQPTSQPSGRPSMQPSCQPSAHPSMQPSSRPSNQPTSSPSSQPTGQPSMQPTSRPSGQPSGRPSMQPSCQPSAHPSTQPSSRPSNQPTSSPSSQPTGQPSMQPTSRPSGQPSTRPSMQPSAQPTSAPSSLPSTQPTTQPTSVPTTQPSMQPSAQPSGEPTSLPTVQPSSQPSSVPTTQPSSRPSGQPTLIPSLFPSSQPTSHPSQQPTTQPSSCPSSQPSSSPSSQPTPLDIINANAFTTAIDGTFVEQKAQFYLGSYVGYFCGIFLLLWFIERTGVYQQTAHLLYDSAYASKVYARRATSTDKTKNYIITTLQAMDAQMEEYRACDGSQEMKIGDYVGDLEANKLVTVQASHSYSYSFYRYLLQKRCVQGCTGVLYPNAYCVDINWLNIHIKLPPGRYEDMLVHLCSSHRVLSCIYSPPNAPISTNGRRFMYIAQYSVAFSLAQIVDSVLYFTGIPDSLGVSFLVGLLIINPIALGFGSLIQSLWLCQCIESPRFKNENPVIHQLLQAMGKVIMVPFLLLILCALVIAAIFSQGKREVVIILTFFCKVQVTGILLEFLLAIFAFKDNFHFNLRLVFLLKSLQVLCIGRLFCERVVERQLVEGVDYSCRHYSFLCGFVQVDIMRSIGTSNGIRTAVEMTVNPLHAGVIDRASEQEGDVTMDTRISYSGLYSTNDDLMTQSREQVTSDILESLRIAASRLIVEDSEEKKQQSIEEARLSYSVLYDISADEMVMQKQMITSDILGSMRMALRPTNSDGTSDDQEKIEVQVSEYDDGMVASEGIVIRKKQFKQGTRQSFINTFHQFQEKEVLMGDNSTSLKNTIMLHSKLVKGNALLSSNTSARTDPSAARMPAEEPTAIGDDAASLKNTMLLHSKLVKGNALLKNKNNKFNDV